MATIVLLVSAALLCLGNVGQAIQQFGLAHFGHLGGHHGIQGGNGGYGGYGSEPVKLTCAVNFTGPVGGDGYAIVNAIAVTVQERQGNHFGGHHAPFGFVGGLGGLHGDRPGGLKATIDIYSAYGGDVKVAFTETARPEAGCNPHDFGKFLTGQDNNGPLGALGGLGFGGFGGLGGGYGAGGYGGLGYGALGYGGAGALGAGYGGLAGGYGAGAYGAGAYGAGFGLGLGVDPFFGFGIPIGGKHGGKNSNAPVPGVIAEINLGQGAASEVNIDRLPGFRGLEDLAGRGVVVCPRDSVESDYDGGRCEGGIIACCALHYDRQEQRLSLGSPVYPGNHGYA